MCGNGTEKPRLVENPGAVRIYADGPASVEIHGPNARITYFELQDWAGEEVKVPVAVIILPAEVCGVGTVTKMTARARAMLGRAACAGDGVPETTH